MDIGEETQREVEKNKEKRKLSGENIRGKKRRGSNEVLKEPGFFYIRLPLKSVTSQKCHFLVNQ